MVGGTQILVRASSPKVAERWLQRSGFRGSHGKGWWFQPETEDSRLDLCYGPNGRGSRQLIDTIRIVSVREATDTNLTTRRTSVTRAGRPH